MALENILQPVVADIIEELYGAKPEKIEFQGTRKEFEGDITLVVFPLLRVSRKGPEQTEDILQTSAGCRLSLV